jgi:hypothetical protein
VSSSDKVHRLPARRPVACESYPPLCVVLKIVVSENEPTTGAFPEDTVILIGCDNFLPVFVGFPAFAMVRHRSTSRLKEHGECQGYPFNDCPFVLHCNSIIRYGLRLVKPIPLYI